MILQRSQGSVAEAHGEIVEPSSPEPMLPSIQRPSILEVNQLHVSLCLNLPHVMPAAYAKDGKPAFCRYSVFAVLHLNSACTLLHKLVHLLPNFWREYDFCRSTVTCAGKASALAPSATSEAEFALLIGKGA